MSTNIDTETQSTALLVVDDNEIELTEAFSKGGLQPVLDKIRKEVLSLVPDTSTQKGRDAIRSNAASVSKAKKGLDDMRKDLVSEMKAQCKIIDAEGKRAKDELDELKIFARKPLTDWEEAEETRVDWIRERIKFFRHCASTENCHGASAEGLTAEFDGLAILPVEEEMFGEFQAEAVMAKQESLNRLTILIEEAKKREADAVELKRLQDAEKERVFEADKAQLKADQEAVEKEEKAEAERERIRAIEFKISNISEIIENVERYIWTSKALSSEILEIGEIVIDDSYEEFQDQAKAAKIETISKLEIKLKEVLKEEDEAQATEEARIAKGKDDAKKLAILDERERVRIKKKKAEDATLARERNAEHTLKINQAAASGLESLEIPADKAMEIVQAISQGLIPNVTIEY